MLSRSATQCAASFPLPVWISAEDLVGPTARADGVERRSTAALLTRTQRSQPLAGRRPNQGTPPPPGAAPSRPRSHPPPQSETEGGRRERKRGASEGPVRCPPPSRSLPPPPLTTESPTTHYWLEPLSGVGGGTLNGFFCGSGAQPQRGAGQSPAKKIWGIG